MSFVYILVSVSDALGFWLKMGFSGEDDKEENDGGILLFKVL